MKTTYLNQLIVRAATLQLEELNKERELLIKLIDQRSPDKIVRFVKKGVKKKHWTQRPENKAKMLKNIKRMSKANAKSK